MVVRLGLRERWRWLSFLFGASPRLRYSSRLRLPSRFRSFWRRESLLGRASSWFLRCWKSFGRFPPLSPLRPFPFPFGPRSVFFPSASRGKAISFLARPLGEKFPGCQNRYEIGRENGSITSILLKFGPPQYGDRRWRPQLFRPHPGEGRRAGVRGAAQDRQTSTKLRRDQLRKRREEGIK